MPFGHQSFRRRRLPALLSLLAATMTLGAGIAANGLLAFLAAGHLAYWIPRVRTPDAER